MDSVPVFGTYTPITCAGAPINLQRACPVVYDLDRDGTKDLIVGELNGYVWFYDNAGTNAAPVFNSNQRLSTQSGYIVDGLAEPHIHFNDWDEDGDLDLVFGEYGPYDGYIRVYLNLSNPGIAQENINPTSTNHLTVTPNLIIDNALIKYSLDKNSFVRINLYSADGQLVASPINYYQASGIQQHTLNLCGVNQKRLPPGIYFVQLETDHYKEVKRITLLK